MASTRSAKKNQDHARGTFSRMATGASAAVGSPWAFAAAAASIVVWGVLGPYFHYSNGWQLVMNSWTDIITFLIVFLLQYTQNRDAKAMNLKLDEIVRAVTGARNELIDIENVSDEDLERLERRYERIRKEVHARRGGKKAA